MAPRLSIALLGQPVERAGQVRGIEVAGLDPGQHRHRRVLGAPLRHDLGGAGLVHPREQPAHQVAEQVDPQRPARAEIAEHPHQVGQAGEHRAAPGQALRRIDRHPVDLQRDAAQGLQLEPGGRDDDVCADRRARFHLHAVIDECLDLVGDHRDPAAADRREEIAVGDERDALSPGQVARREMLADHRLRSDVGQHAREQFLAQRLRVLERHADDLARVAQDLAAHDLVGPCVGDLEAAQQVGELERVAADAEIGGRALQHRDLRAALGDRRDQRGRGGPRADQQHPLAVERQVRGPALRMDHPPAEARHPRPLRQVAPVVPVVARAHPQEARGDAEALAGVGANALDAPTGGLRRPGCAQHPVAVVDVRRQVVLVDHLAEVRQDLVAGRDRRAEPGLEAVAEGVQVAVRADPGVAVGPPGAAEAVLVVEDQEAAPGLLGPQVAGATDARDPGADEQHVDLPEVDDRDARFGLGAIGGAGHGGSDERGRHRTVGWLGEPHAHQPPGHELERAVGRRGRRGRAIGHPPAIRLGRDLSKCPSRETV